MPIGLSLPAALLAATAIGLGSIDVPVPATVALVGMTWKFIKPVRIGEAVAARWRLNRKRDVENPSWGLVTWQVDLIGADDDVKATGEVSRLVARKEHAAEAPAADTAPRSRRRRRSRSGAAPAPAPETPEPAPADVPPPARRRRRRRSGGGGNGGGGNGGGNGHGDATGGGEAHEPAPQPAPAAAAASEPAPAGSETAGIGRVIRRIRGRS